jgi:sugar lactone lactonase YvrE
MLPLKHSSAIIGLGLMVALAVLACHSAPRGPVDTTPPPPPPKTPVLLSRGSPTHGANGIVFDGLDQLYIASVLGDEILLIDRQTGETISTVGANQRVVGPDDVAVGPDGSLYWTSFSTGEVVRLTPEGARSAQLLAPGVNGIAFADDGRLFVTTIFMGDVLYEVDPDLTEPPQVIMGNLGFLNGMDFGPDGNLYGPVWTKGRILRIDVDTGESIVIADGFDTPAAVKFGPDGWLYVVDQVTGEVSQVDTETGAKEVLATLMPGLDNLACDSEGRVFVSNGQDGSVFEILLGGTARTVCAGGMIAPGGVAVLGGPGGESVFVADFWTLREFDGKTGEPRSVKRHLISRPGSITTPFNVSADGDNLIVTSWLFANAVQVYDPEAQEVLESYEDLKSPLNAIRFQGDIIVAELGTSSILRIDPEDPERRSVLAKGLGAPAGLAVTDDDLYVSDWVTGLILQVVKDGVVLEQPTVVAKGLTYPEGLAVDTDGSLLVVEGETGCIKRVDPETGGISVVATGLSPCLPGNHPTWIFNAVAVGPSGTIYATCDTENALYKIE